jgi:competence ComEA-like helix-hairpin-helix protein
LLPEYFSKPKEISKEILAKADSVVKLNTANSSEHKPVKTFNAFYFDPNTITDAQWGELGLGSKTISTIRNYLSKGGKFRRPDDISRIYGLKKDEAERLLPYVRIASREREVRTFYPKRFGNAGIGYSQSFNPRAYARRPFQKSRIIIDINKADSIELETLPGIGNKLATRIIRFRDALGGFHTIDQLAEVYGVDDTLFNGLRTSLEIHSGIFRKIRINYWDSDSLDIHPYIQKHEAKAIVKYRNQHGLFTEADDLGKINFITNEWITRLKPYIILD